MIKTLNLIKGIYKKPTPNVILIGERLNAFPLSLRTLKTIKYHSGKLRKSSINGVIYHVHEWITQFCYYINSIEIIYGYNTITMKISAVFFIEHDKLIMTFLWKYKAIRIFKAILNKNKIKRFKLLDFKTRYKDVIIKTEVISEKIDKYINVTEYRAHKYSHT